MTIRERLEQRMAEYEARRTELQGQIEASTDVDEVRSLTEQLQQVAQNIEQVRADIDSLPPVDGVVTTNTPIPQNARRVGGTTNMDNRNQENALEYRQAFMAYCQNGTPIPEELRGNAANTTSDTGAAIPMTVMREVINTVRKRYGNLYAKVRKLNVRGGVKFPIGALQATATWINESTPISDRKKVGTLTSVTFSYYELELRIATTFLASIVTLEAFEEKVVEILAGAYVEALDKAIVAGDGNGKPLGIINDTAVTNVVTMTAAQFSDWTEWRKRFFSKLPLGYRAGEFIFPLSTVETYLETMADSNNNPIFRQATGLEVNDGDARNPNGRFFGREISLVEPDVLPDFDTASSGDVVGIYWQPNEYAVNENFGWTLFRYFDHETNQWVDKGIAVVDGKVLNPAGFVLIKKA